MLKKTKLVQLLETFSTAEFNDFGKFLNSPFHNESPKMRIMYGILKKYYPAFDHKDCTKENIFCVLYPESKQYDDTKLRERFSDMLKLAENYLSIIDFNEDPVRVKRHELNQYAKRSLRVHFNKKYQEIQAKLDKVTIRNSNYFYDMYLHVKDKMIPLENEKLLLKRIPVYDNMAVEVECFLRFFASKMLKYYSMIQNMERNMNYKYEYKLYEEVMKYVEASNLDKYPSIKIFYLLLRLNENYQNHAVYYELKDLLVKKPDEIEFRDKTLACAELFNFVLHQHMKGKTEFTAEYFEIVKLILKYDAYPTENGWMTKVFFTNFFAVAIIANETEWAKTYIKDYSPQVAPEFREESVLWANSLLYFTEKKYAEALKEISKIKLKKQDHQSYFRIKILLSKIYFEMKDYENVLTLVDSFKHFISSNALLTEMDITKYTNFINAMYTLTLLADKPDEFDILMLEKEINNFSIGEIASQKTWLIEKISTLKISIAKV